MRGPRNGPRTPPVAPRGAPAARRLCARSFSVGHFLVPTRRRLLIGELLLDLLDAPEASVEAAGLEKLGVCALLHQPPLVEDDDLVGLLGNPQPMRHDERAASRHCRPKRAENLDSLPASTAEKTSSRTRMGASGTSERASATRCRWPPERVRPRSPTTVSQPSGKPSI